MTILTTKYLPWGVIKKIPVLGAVFSSMQFPYRFMSVATLFGACFAAFFFLKTRYAGGRLIRLAWMVMLALGIGNTIYHVNDIARNMPPIYLYDAKNLGTTQLGNGEFLIEEVGPIALDVDYHPPVSSANLQWSDYQKKGTNIWMQV